MAQTTPYNPTLPQEVQETINIAMQKVQVLKDEEVSLSRRKVELEKEIARMEITRDTLSAELPKLEATFSTAKQNSDSAKAYINDLKIETVAIQNGLSMAKKELEDTRKEKKDAEDRLSQTVVTIREKTDEFEKEKEVLERNKQTFEQRKKAVSEMISSI